MTAADYQQLQLINQVHAHTIPSWNIFILSLLLPLPGIPIEWKLGVYNTLTTNSLPLFGSIHISQTTLIILLAIGPIGFIILSGLLIFLIIKTIRHLTPLVLILLSKLGVFKINEQLPIFLELTFPSDTSKSAYATEELYKLLHTLARRQTVMQNLLKLKKAYSLEIVSTREDGIRFLMAVPANEAEVMKRSLLSFLPGLKIQETKDYLTQELDEDKTVGIIDLKLSSDFALPLQNQKVLSEHDPISYLTGHMTKLQNGEIISVQIVTTPIINSIHDTVLKRIRALRDRLYKGQPLTPALNGNLLQNLESLPLVGILFSVIKVFSKIFGFSAMFAYSMAIAAVDTSGKSVPFFQSDTQKVNTQEILNPYEQELSAVVKEKINQHLFETSIRLLVITNDHFETISRQDGLLSSLGQFTSPYQSFTTKSSLLPNSLTFKQRLSQFKNRTLSTTSSFNENPILSASEISDLYHFPFTDITKTEGLVKSKSKQLPAPLSLKKVTTKFDVLIGSNQYGGEIVPIGLTKEQRQKHTYVVGKTGTGKTTMLKNMIYQDMVSGKGLAVLDPHGDLIKELLALIPKERIKDVIYFDPSDRDYPIGINILSPGIKFDNIDDEHEWITSSVISVFLKLTPKEYWGHRLEHILRSATLTALQTPSPTLLTIQRLLTDKIYQKRVSATLTDPVLKQFWEKEFKLFGSMQVAAAISPLTNRIGKFITTKMTRHILLQEKSTISIQKIMDEGKILLVNLSKGDLGEDESFFFGTILTSFIQMAAYQRTKIAESKRRDFFLYIDEFQNFATRTFGELMSEGRKFHISLIPSHQNIAQIEDKNLLETITGNANTIICLNASPTDEAFILPYMQPEVEKGEIVNLAPYQFFIKAKNEFSEDAFSGETIKLDVEENQKIKDAVITNTRKRYSLPRKEVEEYIQNLFEVKEVETVKTGRKRAKKLSI